MITIERIEEFLRKRKFHDARAGCVKLLEKHRRDAQGWTYLGQAMVGLKNGDMAKKCFERSYLLDPFASWIDQAYRDADLAGKGKTDLQIGNLLKVPRQTVSAIVLTRDSERTIEACLRNLREAVDEIIVVDTGSIDNTIQLVLSLGYDVHHFEWVDDFSAARNYAMSLTNSDWVIAVDSDEILYPDDVSSIRTVAGLFADHLHLVKVLQMNRIENHDEPIQAGRMIQKSFGFKWIGRVHENLYPLFDEKIQSIAVRIRLLHDGYDANQCDISLKIDRNIALLKLEINERSDQPGPYYFLAREHFFAKQYDSSLYYLEKANELIDLSHPLLPELRKLQYDVLTALHRPEEAVASLKKLIEEMPEYPDGWFWLGMQQLNLSDANVNGAIQMISTSKRLAASYRGQCNFDAALATWKSDYVLSMIVKHIK